MNEPQSQGEVGETEKPQSQGEDREPEKPQLQREIGETEKLQSQGEGRELEKPHSQREVGETEKPQSQGEGSLGTENINYDPLLKAVESGDWEAAKSFLHDHPGAEKARISEGGGTALHAAAIAGHKKIVKELVHLMSEEDLELRTEYYGYTALHSAAANSGIAQIAECIVEKNKKLVSIEDRYGLIPVVVAATRGHYDVMRCLYSVTPLKDLTPENGRSGARLLVSCINGSIFDVALDLLQRCPHLAFLKDRRRWEGIRSPVCELANSPSAFPSGSRIVFWQRWIYSCIGVQPADCSSCLHIDVQIPREGQIDRGNIVKAVFGQFHG
ncbi:hypothetical protein L1049_011286 [Liquidambar formosana]|uniref:Uncharacterized protein n=1 Tax=Liquidambar formosana TaxID=63359 RepID=A0AAP0X223_LIQFO